MAWYEDIAGWFSRNADTIGKVGEFGSKVYNAYSQNNARQEARSSMADTLEQKLMQDYAYQQQLYNYQLANQGSGGGSRGPSISPAAMAAEQKAKMRAEKKAMNTQKQYLAQMSAAYQPYLEASKSLVPKAAQNYGQYLDTSALLNAYLTPKVTDALSQPVKPAWEQQVPQSAYKVAVPQSQVQIPDIFKRGF